MLGLAFPMRGADLVTLGMFGGGQLLGRLDGKGQPTPAQETTAQDDPEPAQSASTHMSSLFDT